MKKYLNVICIHDHLGQIMPLYIIWDNGVKYKIDKVVQRIPAHSLKTGGAGIRYTCVIAQQKRYLFLEENKWFIEPLQ